MVELGWILLVLVWVAWVTQAVLSALMAHKLCRRLGHARRDKFEAYRPTVAVIVPFKGVEPGIEQHLENLCTQAYPDYHLLLVVEAEDDPAVPLLRAVQERFADQRIQLLVAGEAPDTRGQKVHNQLCALRHLLAADLGEEVWVFADSDAAPGPRWLGDLVGPLQQVDRNGATTGYRWLVPSPDASGRVTLASRLASIMNSSAVGFLGRDAFTHAWGGSMAVRRATAVELDYPGLLENTLSDDYMLSRMVKATDTRIRFVPFCLVASPCEFTWGSLYSFAQRQYRITKVYMPWLYYGALMLPALYVGGFISAWAALLTLRGPLCWLAAVPIAAVVASDIARGAIRQRVVRRAFGEETLQNFGDTFILDRWLAPLWMALHGVFMLSAFFGRTIAWRGKTYRMDAPDQTHRLRG